MSCTDKSLKYLKQFGYNVVRLPRTDISPLQLFCKANGRLEPLGEITGLLNPGVNIKLPAIKRDEQMAAISGEQTGGLSLEVGLSILGNILGAMAGTKIGLDAQYKNASKLTFEFRDVLGDSVDIIELDKFLNDAGANSFSKHILEKLNDDEIYLITSVIKSKTIGVDASDEHDASVSVDASAISQALGPKIGTKIDASNSSKITYSGQQELVFGFKAIRLVYELGKYVEFETVKEGGSPLGLAGSNDDGKEYKLLLNNQMIDYNPVISEHEKGD